MSGRKCLKSFLVFDFLGTAKQKLMNNERMLEFLLSLGHQIVR